MLFQGNWHILLQGGWEAMERDALVVWAFIPASFCSYGDDHISNSLSVTFQNTRQLDTHESLAKDLLYLLNERNVLYKQ